MTSYRVDVAELATVIGEMTACQQALTDLAADVRQVTDGLHLEWSGLARDGHAESYELWRGEFGDMSQALAGIRDVGDTAHANYSSAVVANLAMWEQLQ